MHPDDTVLQPVLSSAQLTAHYKAMSELLDKYKPALGLKWREFSTGPAPSAPGSRPALQPRQHRFLRFRRHGHRFERHAEDRSGVGR
jgi:hypothetical protein